MHACLRGPPRKLTLYPFSVTPSLSFTSQQLVMILTLGPAAGSSTAICPIRDDLDLIGDNFITDLLDENGVEDVALNRPVSCSSMVRCALPEQSVIAHSDAACSMFSEGAGGGVD
jgi:hypothetical protein